jgi:hypothetical protein
MAADGAGNPFKDGRANLRDTAKWMISGIAGAATLIVGSSTLSQLGALEPSNPRLWIALAALLAAASLCWIPFVRAVDVLRSELLTLEGFVAAADGEFRQSADVVAGLMGAFPGGLSMRDFVRDYRALRTKAWNDAPDRASAEKAIASLDDRYQTCREACVSQLVALRFDRLVQALKMPGALILLTFLVFTWMANPPKDAPRLFDKPYVEALTPERIAALRSAGVAPACYGPGARLVAVGAPDAGPQTAILMPPPAVAPGCALRTVTISGGAIVKVG